ncbi:ANTAR domain-containing protein [Streptomyces sp. NPDC050743]|uniref:ANTAR domain-containing protein n=1 Tax=Streptomyces sp. NPDC050743 TaxID=3365634 RepID=UPI0037A64D09
MAEDEDHEAEMAALRAEIEQLKHVLASRAEIDQAIGVVAACGRLQPDAALEVLEEVTRHLDTKIDNVAAQLLQWPHSTWLPEGTRAALDHALKRRKTPPFPASHEPEDDEWRATALCRRFRLALLAQPTSPPRLDALLQAQFTDCAGGPPGR